MKFEIKLNQEQYDLLINTLVQVAQSCVRMADAWDVKPNKKKDAKEDTIIELIDMEQDPKKDDHTKLSDSEESRIIDAVIKSKGKATGSTWGGGKTRHEGFISLQTIYNRNRRDASMKMVTYACKQLGIKMKSFAGSPYPYIPVERQGDLEGLLLKVAKKTRKED